MIISVLITANEAKGAKQASDLEGMSIKQATAVKAKDAKQTATVEAVVKQAVQVETTGHKTAAVSEAQTLILL